MVGGASCPDAGGVMIPISPARWTLKWRLAALALALGVPALFGDPYGGGWVRLNPRELAAIVETEVDHVQVEELAGWIVQGRNDYRLLDVRDAASYAEYHIPGAESVQLTELAQYPLSRNEKIVLYSDGGMHSAQAWFLLKARGYRGAYVLLRGLEEWKDRVLFPTLPPDATPEESRRYRARSETSLFFGGSPRTAEQSVDPTPIAMPEVPVASGAPVAPTRKKRKEGC